jgi:hypothetical protein
MLASYLRDSSLTAFMFSALSGISTYGSYSPGPGPGLPTKSDLLDVSLPKWTPLYVLDVLVSLGFES